MIDNFKGKLLVARPGIMQDPRFIDTVVYIYEQSPQVILGLILNKRTNMTIADLHAMRGYHNSGATGWLYRGGPVSEQSLLLLHTDEWMSTNTMKATHGNCISSDELMLEKMYTGNMPKCWRLFGGISTWSLAQLQTEVYKHSAWLVVDPSLESFYNNDGAEQWKDAITLASNRMVDNLF